MSEPPRDPPLSDAAASNGTIPYALQFVLGFALGIFILPFIAYHLIYAWAHFEVALRHRLIAAAISLPLAACVGFVRFRWHWRGFIPGMLSVLLVAAGLLLLIAALCSGGPSYR